MKKVISTFIKLIIIFTEFILILYIFQMVNLTEIYFMFYPGSERIFNITPANEIENTTDYTDMFGLHYQEYPNLNRIEFEAANQNMISYFSSSSITSLKVDDYQDESLTGLNNLPNLTSLVIYSEELNTFPGVSQKSTLTLLALYITPLHTVPNLSEYSSLEIFYYPEDIDTLYNIETIPTYTDSDGNMNSELEQIWISNNVTMISTETKKYIEDYNIEVMNFDTYSEMDIDSLEVV